MLHVAICDDEAAFVQHLSQLLDRYAQETGTELKISTFGDGADLTDPYDPTIDLIFLDIQMGIMDGLRTAQRIREMDGQVSIIFLTTLAQYSLEGYQYQATNYILKPLQYIRLKAEMDKFLARRQKEPDPFVVIANDAGRHRVALRDLRYIETFNRNLLCHTQEQNLISYRTMKEMEAALGDKGFARCHTSYLVNLFYVKGVHKLELTLITGETLPISQPKRKTFLAQLTDYWGGYAVIITLLDVLSFVVEWAYALLFFWILHTFFAGAEALAPSAGGGGGLRPAVGGGDLLQRPARAAGSHGGLLWLCGCLPPGAVDEEGGGGAGVLPRPHCGQLPHAGRRVEPFLRLHRRPPASPVQAGPSPTGSGAP